MKERFDLGTVIVLNEIIFLGYICMNPNIRIVGINPRSTGLDFKDLSGAVKNIITTLMFVENKKEVDAKDYI